MATENNSYRIRTKVGVSGDNVVKVKLDQTYDTLNILSLKLDQRNAYKKFQSDYGIVVGRVLANDGFGIPNVKVSVFIPLDDNADAIERMMYPFTMTTDTDGDKVRYNLLPEYVDDICHQNVGTFPTKRTVLDNDNVLEIFDKYYKFTTCTNNAGDYMIYGVPTGTCEIHVDVDLSDIGVLSQRPRDMVYKGYNINLFESPNRFRKDNNLDYLSQIKTQDTSVYVYPYWGDTSDGSDEIAISRCDINIDYRFEPTCVFMGSIMSDSGSNAFGKHCKAPNHLGEMSTLIAGEGNIEMIRKTLDGKVEEFSIKGNRLIDSDGVWCYQIPMNLDYMMTDEFGNMVPSDNPEKGIPTRTRVRFRISMDAAVNDNTARKRCRYLVPNNPRIDEERYPEFTKTHEVDYEFGSLTKDENYRDLLWNKVYTVKNYIPRLQKHKHPDHKTYSGIKLISDYGSNNPMPYNSLSIRLGFTYQFMCVLSKLFIDLVTMLNNVLTSLSLFFCLLKKLINVMHGIKILRIRIFGFITRPLKKIVDKIIPSCIGISSSICGGETTHSYTFYPGCGALFFHGGKLGADDLGCIRDATKRRHEKNQKNLPDEDKSEYTESDTELRNCIESSLAEQNDAVLFSFSNDWVNGTLYLPMWFRKITKRRKFFFGLFHRDAADDWCSNDIKTNKRLYGIYPCAVGREGSESYVNKDGKSVQAFYHKNSECKECHKRVSYIGFNTGIVVSKKTILGETVYYYKAVEYDTDKPGVDATPVKEDSNNGSVKIMFATDIVLLGSLNDCDSQGIPQFFKSLESTTYNMPPTLLYTDNEFTFSFDSTSDSDVEIEVNYKLEQKSTTEKTGCDWGNNNDDICSREESGLFYDIGCKKTGSTAKSCFNLQRICEFGVSLDESKKVLKRASTDEKTPDDVLYDTLIPDGFVSKDEIDNETDRTIFATLNGNNLKTRVNENTGMVEYDFVHLIADNFDKSLREYMAKRLKSCDKTQKYNYMLENFSQGYYEFRMGTNPYYYNTSKHDFPRYENSFYFYFGLKEGKTAIDKFNSQFYSDCMSDEPSDDVIGVITKGDGWCTQTGGYVALNLTQIEKPCTLLFTDMSNGGDVIDVTGMEFNKVYFASEPFGYRLKNSSRTNSSEITYDAYKGMSDIDKLRYVCVESVLDGYEYIDLEGSVITNGKWRLTVTDVNGEIYDVDFSKTGAYINVSVTPYSFKVSEAQLKRDYNGNYFAIASALNNDGFRAIGGYVEIDFPTDGDTGEYLDSFKVEVYLTNDRVSYDVVFDKNGDTDRYCGIVYGNTVHNETRMTLLNKDDYLSDKVIKIGLPKCNEEYTVTVTQRCDDVETNNIVTNSFTVGESKGFKLYINGVVDYDTISHWKCGMKVTVNSPSNSGSIVVAKDGDVSSHWFNLSDERNYNWMELGDIRQMDKRQLQILKSQRELIELLDKVDFSIYDDYIKSLPDVYVTFFEELKTITTGKPSLSGGNVVYTDKTYAMNSNNYIVEYTAGMNNVTIADSLIYEKIKVKNGKVLEINGDQSAVDCYITEFVNNLKGGIMSEIDGLTNYKQKVFILNRNDVSDISQVQIDYGTYASDYNVILVTFDNNPTEVYAFIKNSSNSTYSLINSEPYDNTGEQLFTTRFIYGGNEITYDEFVEYGDAFSDTYGKAYIKKTTDLLREIDLMGDVTYYPAYVLAKGDDSLDYSVVSENKMTYTVDPRVQPIDMVPVGEYDSLDTTSKSFFNVGGYQVSDIDSYKGYVDQYIDNYEFSDINSTYNNKYKEAYNNPTGICYCPDKKLYRYDKYYVDPDTNEETLVSKGYIETSLRQRKNGYTTLLMLNEETEIGGEYVINNGFRFDKNNFNFIHTTEIENGTRYDFLDSDADGTDYKIELTFEKTMIDLLDKMPSTVFIRFANSIRDEQLLSKYKKRYTLNMDNLGDISIKELYSLGYRNVYTNAPLSQDNASPYVKKDYDGRFFDFKSTYYERYTLIPFIGTEQYDGLSYDAKSKYEPEYYEFNKEYLEVTYDIYAGMSDTLKAYYMPLSYYKISDDNVIISEDQYNSLSDNAKSMYTPISGESSYKVNGEYYKVLYGVYDRMDLSQRSLYESDMYHYSPAYDYVGEEIICEEEIAGVEHPEYIQRLYCKMTVDVSVGDPDAPEGYEECYVSSSDGNDIIGESTYQLLDTEEQGYYEVAYVNKSDSSDIITETEYIKNTDGYKRDYVPKYDVTLSRIDGIIEILKNIYYDDGEEVSGYISDFDDVKREYIYNVRSTFQICDEFDGISLSYIARGDESDLPAVYHSVYKGEKGADNSYEITDTNTTNYDYYEYNIVEEAYTYNNRNIVGGVTIPTLTANERFIIDATGGYKEGYKANGEYYFARDPFYKVPKKPSLMSDPYVKRAYFVAVNNADMEKTIPSDCEIVTTARGSDTVVYAKTNYFGFHLIDKFFKFEGICWSIPSCMSKESAFFAGKIINGAAEYSDSCKYTYFDSFLLDGVETLSDETMRLYTVRKLKDASNLDDEPAKIEDYSKTERVICMSSDKSYGEKIYYKVLNGDPDDYEYNKNLDNIKNRLNQICEIEKKTMTLSVTDFLGYTLDVTLDGAMEIVIMEDSVIYQERRQSNQWCIYDNVGNNKADDGTILRIHASVINSSSDDIVYYMCEYKVDNGYNFPYPDFYTDARNIPSIYNYDAEFKHEWKEITHRFIWGSILGYGVINKSIWHIFSTIDIDKISEGMTEMNNPDNVGIPDDGGYYYDKNTNDFVTDKAARSTFRCANISDTGMFTRVHKHSDVYNWSDIKYDVFIIAENDMGTRTISDKIIIRPMDITLTSDSQTTEIKFRFNNTNKTWEIFDSIIYAYCDTVTVYNSNTPISDMTDYGGGIVSYEEGGTKGFKMTIGDGNTQYSRQNLNVSGDVTFIDKLGIRRVAHFEQETLTQ